MAANRKQIERILVKEEQQRRRALDTTVYGVVDKKGNLLRCWQDNNGFQEVDKKPTFSMSEKFEPALLIPKPIKIFEGGRGSMKTETVAAIMASRVKDYKHKVGAFREYQATIEDSVHSVISKKIANLGYQGFEVQDNKVLHDKGGSVRYRGLARNPTGIKSMDDFNDFWVEEAEIISDRSLEIIEPTARKKGAEIWYTLNRGSSADPIAREHLKAHDKELLNTGYYEDDTIMIIRVHWTDNPWFPEVLETKRKKNQENWPKAKYAHVWDGEYMDEVDNSIISAEWFDAAIDAHVKLGFKPKGQKVVSFDPSDEGEDAMGLVYRHGNVFVDAFEIDAQNGNDACDVATSYAINHSVDKFTWDGDGMGALLRNQIAEAFDGKKIDAIMYKGSESVELPEKIYNPNPMLDIQDPRTNDQTFRNRRSQQYIRLMDMFYNTYRAVVLGEYVDPTKMISISSEIDCLPQLRSEICRIPLKPNNAGLIQIMSKQEMKQKYDIDSPNLADSAKMSLLSMVVKNKSKYDDWSIPIN